MCKYFLKDVVEVVNKIRCHKSLGGLTDAEKKEIFGTDVLQEILRLDVVTLVEKYKKWETGYRKGEIVSTTDGQFGVVTYVNEKGEPHVLCENGMTKYYNNTNLTRLGKKMDVAKFLSEIKTTAVPEHEKTNTENGVFVTKVAIGADHPNGEIDILHLLREML